MIGHTHTSVLLSVNYPCTLSVYLYIAICQAGCGGNWGDGAKGCFSVVGIWKLLYTSIHMLHFFLFFFSFFRKSTPDQNPLQCYALVIGRFFLNLTEEHESHSKLTRLIYLTLYCIQHETGAWIRIHLFLLQNSKSSPAQYGAVRILQSFDVFPFWKGRGTFFFFFSNILTTCTNLENNIVRCVH